MNINSTLFAQSLNFLIAYCVLRILIFRPAVKAIMDQAHEHTQQQHTINQITNQIEVCKKEQTALWDAARGMFERTRPEDTKLHEQVFRDLNPSLHPVEIPEKSQEAIKSDLSNALVDRLKRC